jgi:ribonuclease HI
MSKKAYVVFVGRKPGIYLKWGKPGAFNGPDTAMAQVEKFKGAVFKGFDSVSEAEKAFDDFLKTGDGGRKFNDNAYRIELRQFISANSSAYQVWTDGGVDRNPGGNGGFGYIVISPDGTIFKEGFGFKNALFDRNDPENPTNNRMELMGAISGLSCVPEGEEAVFMTDSEIVYADVGFNTDSDPRPRLIKWEEKGWLNSSGNKPENFDLLLKLYEIARKTSLKAIPRPVATSGYKKKFMKIAHSSLNKEGKWDFPYNVIADKLAEYGEIEAQAFNDNEYHYVGLISSGIALDDRAMFVSGIDENLKGNIVDRYGANIDKKMNA